MGLSPMMQHYLDTKKEYPDCILFYRLGDFYEMFFEDAKLVSSELELTLTGRDCGLEERAPMCGVPFHAADTYITRLNDRGYRVAICEQVEDPKLAKGMVKREVVRVVTPGTTLDTEGLDEGRNNYLMCVVSFSSSFGISVADVTTGQCFLTEADSCRKLNDEISKFMPAEIICNQAFLMSDIDCDDLRERLRISISSLPDWYFDDSSCQEILFEHFHCSSMEGLGIQDFAIGIPALGAMFRYLYDTQKSGMAQMTTVTPYRSDTFMLLDSSTRRNLELTETLREKQKRGSLLWVLDKTKTAMGARLLRRFIEEPLVEEEKISQRQQAVEELVRQPMIREEIREYLQPIYDLERISSRIIYQSANPRDLIAFRNSLEMLPYLRQLLTDAESELLQQIREDMDPLEDLFTLIRSAINEEPPLAMKDGGIIRDGYHPQVDRYRAAKNQGKQWLGDLEAEEREKTGIRNLKVKFNRVFGYYLEVTNSFRDLVPDYYTRKQTLTNAERYTTTRLKELEETILGAEDRLNSLEYELFAEVREKVGAEVERIQRTAAAVASLDVFASLAYVAEQNHYVRPKLNKSGKIDIREGRHPVVEQMLPDHLFIANDTYLDRKDHRVSVITGPNMAGKSTYMRQTALIVLMTQIGSFVPAVSANIGIADRIFTRVGASDDLASGQSTFMVEMTEVANILRHATPASLLILDEIGRGTSTFDGLSIAWAVIEHIADKKKLGARTLFATHYHELTELEGKLPGVRNYCIAVKEKGKEIVFLRKIIAGGADKSYGIQVARLAGLPESVLERADELVLQLVDADITETVKTLAGAPRTPARKKLDDVDRNQMTLFDAVSDQDLLKEITDLELSMMTPLEALNELNRIQSRIRNRWSGE